jgi:ABC-2 type transport system permease protein
MKKFAGLVRRELREHPALYAGPLVVNLFIAVSTLLLVARAVGSVENLRSIVEAINMADPDTFEAGRNALIASPIAAVIGVTVAVGYFYFIDCLYAERRERTILFFKSFPVTDTETVLSKLFCGVVVLPLLSLAAFALTQILVLTVVSVAMSFAGGSIAGLWSLAGILANWVFILYALVSCALWYAPFIAFLILVSAWAKRAVFLWSIAPFLIIQAEFLFPGRNVLAPLVFGHISGYAAAAFAIDGIVGVNAGGELSERFRAGTVNPLALADPGGFLSEPALWAGLLVACFFVTAAIFLRRYRDDS